MEKGIKKGNCVELFEKKGGAVEWRRRNMFSCLRKFIGNKFMLD